VGCTEYSFGQFFLSLLDLPAQADEHVMLERFAGYGD
jgi:hypothetical protein